MITLLAALVLAQAWPGEPPADPPIRPRVFRSDGADRTSRLGADDYAYFEFAPSSGAGMGAPCACTTPTGAKGETLTFTRASSGMCTLGNTTTGIENGDLVLCSTNQPRVMPGGDGTGTRGLLVEGATTNSALRSQEMDNGSWSLTAGATRTANQAVAPDGTSTADLLTFTSGGAESVIYQAITRSASPWSDSIYLKGSAGSGTVDLVQFASAVNQFHTACSYVSTSWTRCKLGNNTLSAITFYFILGCEPQGQTSACTTNPSVYVWGAQAEALPYVSSYVPTTTTAVARAADAPIFTLPALDVTAPWSFAGSVVLPAVAPAAARLHGTLGPSGLGSYVFDSYFSTTWFLDSTQITPNFWNTTITHTLGTSVRAASYHDGTNANGCIDGVCGAGVARAWTTINSVVTYKPGMYSTTNGVVDGVVSRICWDPYSYTRCR